MISGPYGEIKTVLEALFDGLGVTRRIAYVRGAPAPFWRDRSATLQIDGKTIGFAGELGRRAEKDLGLHERVSLFELRADALIAAARHESTYERISRYPAVERDLAVVVDEGVSWGRISDVVCAAAGDLLTGISPFDAFRGSQVGEGRKSIAPPNGASLT